MIQKNSKPNESEFLRKDKVLFSLHRNDSEISAGAHEIFAVEGAGEGVIADDSVPRRGVDEEIVPDIDAHMRDFRSWNSFKKNKITFFQSIGRNGISRFELLTGSPWKVESVEPVDGQDESAAVKTFVRRVPTPCVGVTDIPLGRGHQMITESVAGDRPAVSFGFLHRRHNKIILYDFALK